MDSITFSADSFRQYSTPVHFLEPDSSQLATATTDYYNTSNQPIANESWKSYSSTKDVAMELPVDMRFNDGHVVSIAAYSILMLLSLVGNSTVFALIRSKQKKRRSRVNLLLMHLSVADLLVTLLLMPLEIAWAVTVTWWAGDVMCRLMAFFRIFGLYLSSFVLVCISFDRYNAVLHPLRVRDANRRAKIMLAIAWIGAALCSSPQMWLFHVEQHPHFLWYYQCVVFNSYPTRHHELLYNLFVMAAMYGFPLVVIVITYGAIIIEITQKSRECNGPPIEASCSSSSVNGSSKHIRGINLRRSGTDSLNRARSKSLRMTIIMVAVFILCWTPYYIICMWFWVDFDSASSLDPRIQRGLFIFASSNSCVNPLVYGLFMVKCTCQGKREHQDWVDEWLSVLSSMRNCNQHPLAPDRRENSVLHLNHV